MQAFPQIPNTELFLVGGSVRDHLLHQPAKDRDFVALTELSFEELVEAVNTVGRVFLASPEHLTIRCRIGTEAIDIALPRVESGTTDNRHPEIVTRAATLEEDASRRDFTINSMFMAEDGEIFDFHGGRRDIESGIIRTVGSPMARFREDALRVLRAIRFSCKLDFTIEKDTGMAISIMTPFLNNISSERIREEVNGAMRANTRKAFQTFDHFNLFGIFEAKGVNFEATLKEL